LDRGTTPCQFNYPSDKITIFNPTWLEAGWETIGSHLKPFEVQARSEKSRKKYKDIAWVFHAVSM
jgi:hypothetical protein